MTKTHRQFLSEIRAKMQETEAEKKEKLRKAYRSPFSKKLKENIRFEIKEIYDNKMQNFRDIPGYKEALEAARYEGKMKHRLKRARQNLEIAEKNYKAVEHTGDEGEMKNRLHIAKVNLEIAEKNYKAAELAYRGEENIIREDLENLKGNTEAILNYLKEKKYIQVIKDAKLWGHRGMFVHINIPPLGDFERFRFNAFVSNDEVENSVVDRDEKLRENLYSKEEVSELLQAINNFMKKFNGDSDESDYYEWAIGIRKVRCKAGNHVKTTTGLNGTFLLREPKESRTDRLNATSDYFYFDKSGGDRQLNKLLVKLPN